MAGTRAAAHPAAKNARHELDVAWQATTGRNLLYSSDCSKFPLGVTSASCLSVRALPRMQRAT